MPGRRLWVELEGIGGAGKTTQAESIAAYLRESAPQRRVVMVSEFSGSAIGDEIRARLRDLRFELSSSRATYEILYSVADASRKGVDALTGEEWDIAIVDRYRWSIGAHILALAPPDLSERAVAILPEVAERIVALLPEPTCEIVCVYLRCPPVVAAVRLALRAGAPLNDADHRFIRLLHAAYERIAKEHTDVHVVDASAPAATVMSAILDIVLQRH
jgi:thymidylate kinase